MLEIYLLSISEAEQISPELCEKLFPERMEQSRHFWKREDAVRCIAAGALMAFLLGVKEEEISFNKWGKPFLTGKDLCFSLSHSGDFTLLAADDGEVGADIEKNAPFNRKVAERVFTSEELNWMDKAPQTRFFELWTMKESVMKLDGRGFSLPPESFSVLPLMNGRSLHLDCGTIYGRTEAFCGYTVSVCALHPVEDTLIRVITAAELTKQFN